jgi:predicted DNA-binding transcriptional regulator YafY
MFRGAGVALAIVKAWTDWRARQPDRLCYWNHNLAAAATLWVQLQVWSERQLEVVYCRGDGTTVERRVDPLGLVAKGSVWYLLAAVAGEARVYRVARLIDVRVLDHSIIRPPRFDLAVYWRQTSAAFNANIPRVTVLVRVAPPAIAAVRSARRVVIEREEAPAQDGWVKLSLRFDSTEETRAFVLGRGPLVEVLEPSVLREEVARLATETAELYSRSTETIGIGAAQSAEFHPGLSTSHSG